MNLGLRKLRQKDCQKCKATQGVLNSGGKKAEKQKPQEAQLKDEESRTQRGDGNQLTGPKGGDGGERMVTRPGSFSPCSTRPGGEVPPCTQRS